MTIRHMPLVLATAALVLGTTVSAQVPQQSQGTPSASAHNMRREPHPQIRKAIRALEAAKSDLQHASHDFGGHRVAALAACDNAIQQLRLALQYDKQ